MTDINIPSFVLGMASFPSIMMLYHLIFSHYYHSKKNQWLPVDIFARYFHRRNK